MKRDDRGNGHDHADWLVGVEFALLLTLMCLLAWLGQTSVDRHDLQVDLDVAKMRRSQ